MSKKTNRSAGSAGGPCICQGVAPALSELLRRVGPPKEARGHFEAARLEFLKGLRALLDARIERCAKTSRRGQKITVE